MRLACLLLVLLCALAGCGGGDRIPEAPVSAPEPDIVVTPPVVPPPPVVVDPVPQAYRDANVAWVSAGLQNYHFTLDTVCFCGPVIDPSRLGPVRVVVRGGVATGATFVFSGAIATPQEVAQLPTISKLFEAGAKAYQRDGAVVSFQAGGSPVHLLRLAIDPSPLLADDEITYLVTDFAAD